MTLPNHDSASDSNANQVVDPPDSEVTELKAGQELTKEQLEAKQIAQALYYEPLKVLATFIAIGITIVGIFTERYFAHTQRVLEFQTNLRNDELSRMIDIATSIDRMVGQTFGVLGHDDFEHSTLPSSFEILERDLEDFRSAPFFEIAVSLPMLVEIVTRETPIEDSRQLVKCISNAFQGDELTEKRLRFSDIENAILSDETMEQPRRELIVSQLKKIDSDLYFRQQSELDLRVSKIVSTIASVRSNFSQQTFAGNWENGLSLLTEWQSMKSLRTPEMAKLFSSTSIESWNVLSDLAITSLTQALEGQDKSDPGKIYDLGEDLRKHLEAEIDVKRREGND